MKRAIERLQGREEEDDRKIANTDQAFYLMDRFFLRYTGARSVWLLFWNFDNNNRDDDDENDDLVTEISLSYQLALFYILSLESREKYKHFYCHSFFISSQQWKCTTIGRSCPNKGTSTRPKPCTWGIPIQLKILRFRSSAAVVWDEWHLEDSSLIEDTGEGCYGVMLSCWKCEWVLLLCHAVKLMKRTSFVIQCKVLSNIKWLFSLWFVCYYDYYYSYTEHHCLSCVYMRVSVWLLVCIPVRGVCVCLCVIVCVKDSPPLHTHPETRL